MAWQVGDLLKHINHEDVTYKIERLGDSANRYFVSWNADTRLYPYEGLMHEQNYYLVNEQGERIERQPVAEPRHIIRYMVIYNSRDGTVGSETWTQQENAERQAASMGDRLLGLKKLKVTY